MRFGIEYEQDPYSKAVIVITIATTAITKTTACQSINYHTKKTNWRASPKNELTRIRNIFI